MPVELGVWRIDKDLIRLNTAALDNEERLESILEKDISIISPNWMVLGRQVPTTFGGFIDLLVIDADGNLVVLELKKDRTPRDVVAQILDYASWVKDLDDDKIAEIYNNYTRKYHPESDSLSLDDAFRQRFRAPEMPESLNSSQELVVVATHLDDSTERIVAYLNREYGVPVNAVFFRVFKDGDREYLSRIWFIDPTGQAEVAQTDRGEPWNGEFYVSFGEDECRRWADAIKYGFIAAGHGTWYSRGLNMLKPDDRIWVNIPHKGYVGVGLVTRPSVRVDKFIVDQTDGKKAPITELPIVASEMFADMHDDELAEYVVGVQWIKVLPLEEAVREKGFFGNQNTVARPTSHKWSYTVERLKQRFGIRD